MNKVLLIIFLAMLSCNRHTEHCNSSNGNEYEDSLYIEDFEYDFGLIPDTVTQITHNFKIVNNTSQSQRIKRIEKSCGCTNVSLSDSLISPHSSSYITINIDIASNYNYFERDVSVYFYDHKYPKSIYIRASRELPKHLIKREFPIKLSEELRINIPYLLLGNVQHGEAKSVFLNILNTSDKEVRFKAQLENPNDTIFSIYCDDYIQAGDIGKIIVLADLSDICNFWGRYKDNLILSSSNHAITIPIEAIFTAPFTTTETLKPRIMIPIDHYTILKKNKQADVVFEIQNLGNSDLRIFCVKTSHSIKYELSDSIIKPKGMATLTCKSKDLVFSEIELEINTNDSYEPLKILRISKM